MTLIAIVIYIVLQIVLLPLGMLGAIWVAYKQLGVSKRLGLSQTAVEVINGRWTMDVFGIRDDRAARRLARVLPNDSVAGLWLALLPLYILYRISGRNMIYPRVPKPGKEGIADLMISRTLYFDAIIEKHAGSATQFVVLGAGLDTRAYAPDLKDSLTFFELDQSNMQRMKKKRLKKARLSSKHIHFVEVDFEKSDWSKELTGAGFDASKRTIFLWEGVTLYLSKDAINKTLSTIKKLGADGSVLICDIYADRFMEIGKSRAARKALEMTDETLAFGLDFSSEWERALEGFVNSQGMKVGETHFLGHRHKKGPYAVVAEALI